MADEVVERKVLLRRLWCVTPRQLDDVCDQAGELVPKHGDLTFELAGVFPWRNFRSRGAVPAHVYVHASRSLVHWASSLSVFLVAARGLVTRRVQLA